VTGALASIAVFEKDIKDEIITLTSTQQNVTIPGESGLYTLTTTTPENANKSRVRGVELNILYSRFTFLPGWLSGFGARGNIAFMNYDAPYIRMSDGSFRHLPQLISSAHEVANAALFYSYRQFIGEISYNHTGKQPISFDTNNAVNDQWWAAIDTVDAQLRYLITRNLDIRFQAKNLLDSRPQKVVGPDQGLNYSTLENGRAYFVGVGFHF
jgi:TonB-dependent receptor